MSRLWWAFVRDGGSFGRLNGLECFGVGLGVEELSFDLE